MELKIEHLSKQFKDKTAVNDVNLTLTPGVWGLLGANGAGKTTLMRMIADIMTPRFGIAQFRPQSCRNMKCGYALSISAVRITIKFPFVICLSIQKLKVLWQQNHAWRICICGYFRRQT